MNLPFEYTKNQIDDFIIIDDKRVETAWYGPSPKEAPTLVFLHQGLGCVELWRDYPRKLAAATNCGALLYSRFGYGKSAPCSLPRPVRFMHDEALHVLPQLLEETSVRDCVLIGHSDGGSIALIYAGSLQAGPLRGVITEAAHIFFEGMTIPAQKKAKESFEKGVLRRKLEKYHGKNTECAFRGWNDVWMSPEFASWDLREYLPNIRVPMLVIQGENDEYGTIKQVTDIKELSGGKTETLLVPDCGHSPHSEQEDVVFNAMVDFLMKVLW